MPKTFKRKMMADLQETYKHWLAQATRMQMRLANYDCINCSRELTTCVPGRESDAFPFSSMTVCPHCSAAFITWVWPDGGIQLMTFPSDSETKVPA